MADFLKIIGAIATASAGMTYPDTENLKCFA